MFGLGMPELLLILIIALVVFGPAKLPQVGAAIGQTIKEFKKSTRELEDDIKKEVVNPLIGETKTEKS